MLNLTQIKKTLKKYLLQIIVGVLIGLIVLFLWNTLGSDEEQPQPETPLDIEIDAISYSPKRFYCDKYSDFDIEYDVAHLTGNSPGFSQPFYKFINQTKNTCIENFTFFNSTEPEPFCYNAEGEEPQHFCNSKITPLREDTRHVTSSLSNYATRLIKTFKENNVSNCELTEQIKICIETKKGSFCSHIREINLEYFACPVL